jgi:DNA-binding NtrC family response regulator
MSPRVSPNKRMTMRGAASRKRDGVVVSPLDFGWDRAAIATMRHCSLPWFGVPFEREIVIPAIPLTAVTTGRRDRLSLLAQFAAHSAFLQFAGVADGEVDPAEWAVIQKRGNDCRLVRIAAKACPIDTAPPALTTAQQFAEILGIPDLAVLKRSWARADAVYAEAAERLTADSAADLRWVTQATDGEMAAPGSEALRSVLMSRERRFCGHAAFASIEAMAALDGGVRVIRLGSDALPSRFGAIAPLRELAGPFEGMTEPQVAEKVAGFLAGSRILFLVSPQAAFDPPSWKVVELLSRFDDATWIFADGEPSLPGGRSFAMTSRIGRPAGKLASLPEPRRSYVGALALLGDSIPREVAVRFLSRFFFEQPLEELVIEGATWLRDDAIGFVSEIHREEAMQTIPPASRPALCRVAAEVAGTENAAALLIQAGDYAEAAALLESAPSGRLPEALKHAPRSLLGERPELARRYADALADEGRYRDASEIASLLRDEERELILARCERRTGDYAPALARLERLDGCEALLLRAEILSVTGRSREAAEVLSLCRPSTDEDRVRIGYAAAIIALDTDLPADESWMAIAAPSTAYLKARLATYRRPSIESADAALALARSAVEKSDALMDRVYVLFSAGRWPEARQEAIAGLAEIDETQGDRAAGGFLFFLAFLAADDGQWQHAAQWTQRLRHFYRATGDELRLSELDLLSAHLDFSRGRFGAAAPVAAAVLEKPHHPQIRQAAALILDEIAWISRSYPALRSSEMSQNTELDDRHRLLRARRGDAVEPKSPFHAALFRWESGTGGRPHPSSCSEKLKLFRSALARGLAEARELASELEITLEDQTSVADDVRVLRSVATASFPFSAADFCGVPWKLATRNRLGHWTETGTAEAVGAEELDRIASSRTADWLQLGERELLMIAGSSSWPEESRAAIAEIVRIKSENYRLRRIVEQDDNARPAADPNEIEGIVGQSPPMRELYGRIPLVARRDVAVCITGESGTGKELVARSIHRHSNRRSRPFTAVNCAALPDNLIESELFGHVRGAFTGADRDRPGLIETSDGGTLFLDEIGEMPVAAQAKLLRFLQEGEFRRVGETVNRSADVRIVSATNRKLESAVAEGRFREDLYYRVCGVALELPSLRERPGDVALLASHFLAAERSRHRGGPANFTEDVDAAFRAYRWPGNVRELQNAIRAAHAMAGDAREIDLEHLPERLRSIARPRGKASSYQDEVTRFRRELIERSLSQARGNQNQAAALLNMSRQALAYQIRELGILVGKADRSAAM